MSAAMSYSLQAAILAWLSGTAMPTAPTTVYMGLLTTAPNPNGTGVVEPTSGYARQAVTLSTPTQSGGTSTVQNENALVFGPATADWPQVNYAALFDQAGSMLAYTSLAAARVAPNGDTISFGAGAMQFALK